MSKISFESAKNIVVKYGFCSDCRHKYESKNCVQCDCYTSVKQIMDAVPVEAYEQVKWERDQAIDQLNSIGKGFGEKMDDVVPVVRCKECIHYTDEIGWCDVHSCFIDRDGTPCSPSESSNWKMFDEDYFCKDGERKDGDE